MTTVKFKDGTEVEVMAVNAGTQFVQGHNRDVLEFVVEVSVLPLDELAALVFNEALTQQITIVTEVEGVDAEYIYTDYVLPTAKPMSLVNELVTPATSEAPAVYEQRIKLELAQKTYLEKAIDTQAQALATLQFDSAMNNAELFEMILSVLEGGEIE